MHGSHQNLLTPANKMILSFYYRNQFEKVKRGNVLIDKFLQWKFSRCFHKQKDVGVATVQVHVVRIHPSQNSFSNFFFKITPICKHKVHLILHEKRLTTLESKFHNPNVQEKQLNTLEGKFRSPNVQEKQFRALES